MDYGYWRSIFTKEVMHLKTINILFSLNYYFENKFFKMADQIVFTHKRIS